MAQCCTVGADAPNTVACTPSRVAPNAQHDRLFSASGPLPARQEALQVGVDTQDVGQGHGIGMIGL
jgi:hypothetical protein